MINHNADNALVTFRYRLKDVEMEAAEEPFEAADASSIAARSSFAANGDELRRVANELGIQVYAVRMRLSEDASGSRRAHRDHAHVAEHAGRRLVSHRLDHLQVPFTYISTQDVSRDPNLKSKYDVILFAPVGRGAQAIINGLPMYGNPLPWKKTQLTPNLGGIDETDDMRPGLGWSGLQNLQKFVKDGGLFITVDDTSEFAVNYGFTAGVSANRSHCARSARYCARRWSTRRVRSLMATATRSRCIVSTARSTTSTTASVDVVHDSTARDRSRHA